EFAVELGHGSGCNFCPNIASGAPRAGVFYGSKAAVDAVCIAFLFAQIQEQSGRGSAAQNMIRDGQRDVIRIATVDSDIGGRNRSSWMGGVYCLVERLTRQEVGICALLP